MSWPTILLLLAAVVALLVLARRHYLALTRLRHQGVSPAVPAARSGQTEGAAQVLAWMRHEIRTPINAVIGMADLLLDGDLAAQQRAYLGMLRASAESLSGTFDDLTDLCRLDARDLSLDAQPFNLREAVEVALDQVAPMAAERALDLSCDIAPGTPDTLLGDVGRLRQMLTLLLNGAFRRTHTGGVSVSVSAARTQEGDVVRFRVRDSGIPLPPDRARVVLQPLARIVSSPGKVADAEDLGLALCHGLAGLMGGSLALVPGDGPGSTLELTIAARVPERVLEASRGRRQELPANAPRAEGLGGARQHDLTPGPIAPLRILLAEDSEVGRAVAVDVLQRLGHAVDVAGDGLAVLEALERRDYDVVLMDMNMPRMDGLTATREICRRWPREGRPRIIALTASDLPEDRAAWTAAGADGWLSKMLPPDELRQVLGGPAGPNPEAPQDQRLRNPPGTGAHLDMFLRESSRLLLLLRDAVECQDSAAAQRAAHTLSGSAAMVGAAPVARGCTDLILEVKAGRFEEAALSLARLDQALAALKWKRVLPVAPDGSAISSSGPVE